jgi:hypothetical protein
MATIEELEGLFDDHPSLDASLQDFEPGSSEIGQSPRFGYPSHHSGFRSDSESEMADSVSGGRFSPPAWRRKGNGNRSSGFWNRGVSTLGKRSYDSRESSPEYEDADDGQDATLAAATRTRLPTGSLSPEKQRSPSPDPFPSGGRDFGNTFGEIKQEEEGKVMIVPSTENPNNCMRFPCTFQDTCTDKKKIFASLSEQKFNIAQSHSRQLSLSSRQSSKAS